LKEVAPVAGRVFFVSQVPVIREDTESNLRELVTWHMKHRKDLPLFYPDSAEPLRKQAVAAAESETKSFSNLSVLRPDLLFYKDDGTIRYESGQAFFYADSNHLSEMGAEEVRSQFRNAIAQAVSGSSRQADIAR